MSDYIDPDILMCYECGNEQDVTNRKEEDDISFCDRCQSTDVELIFGENE